MRKSRSQNRVRGRLPARFLSSVILALAMLGVAAVSGLAAEPTIEATGSSLATYAWTPSTAEVDSGGSVTFKNPTANLHGLVWESGPETPSCTGTPSVGKANWSGSCTFAQGGAYGFYCPVHPSVMKGAVTVIGPAAPVVSTGSATAVSESEATLNGTVNPSEQETSYFFEYGTTAAYGQKTTEASAGSGASPVDKSATVVGLTASTTYHFRLVAKNASGTTHGSDRTFTTRGPPSATTSPATAVTDTSAMLNGSFNPGGFQATYFFEYGTTTAYGSKTVPGGAGNGTGISFVSMSVAGLSPQTTYHFQLVAENAAGTAFGGDRIFTTAAVPPLDSPPVITPTFASTSPSPPDTKITLKPRAKTRDRTPTFKFTTTVPGGTFECSVDRKPPKPCRSPYTTPALKPGRHTFKVAAVANGSTDPTPAGYSFKVLAKKK
jgi:plastocyanin